MKFGNFEKKNSELHLRVTWTEADWKEVLNLARGEIAATLKVKGFRPGKSPINTVDQFVPASRILEVAESLAIEQAVQQLIKKHGKEIEGYRIFSRVVEKVSFSEIELLFMLEQLPSIELKAYKNLGAKIPSAKIKIADIQQRIIEKKSEFATFKAKKTAAAVGDKVVLDYSGSVDGDKLKYGSAKNHELIIGSKKMIPGFEESLVGMAPGTKKTVTLTFPKNYSADLAGKGVDFTLAIKKVSAPVPASDDELIDRLNHPNLKKTDDITTIIIEELEKEQQEQKRPKLLSEIKQKILKLANIVIPKAYFTREFKRMKQAEVDRLTHETKKEFKDYLKSQAKTEASFDTELKKRLRILIEDVLLIHHVAQKEKIVVNGQEVDQYYEFLRNYTKKSQADVERMYPRSSLENHFLRVKVEEFLLTNNDRSSETAKPTTKKKTSAAKKTRAKKRSTSKTGS